MVFVGWGWVNAYFRPSPWQSKSSQDRWRRNGCLIPHPRQGQAWRPHSPMRCTERNLPRRFHKVPFSGGVVTICHLYNTRAHLPSRLLDQMGLLMNYAWNSYLTNRNQFSYISWSICRQEMGNLVAEYCIPWSSWLFSSSLDGCVHTGNTAKICCGFLSCRSPKQQPGEAHERGLSCLALAGHYLGFFTVPCILTLDPLVLSSSLVSGPSEGCDFLSWQAAGRGKAAGQPLLWEHRRVINKGAHGRVCSGNIDNVRENEEREMPCEAHHRQHNTPSSLHHMSVQVSRGSPAMAGPNTSVSFSFLPSWKLRYCHEFFTSKMVNY